MILHQSKCAQVLEMISESKLDFIQLSFCSYEAFLLNSRSVFSSSLALCMAKHGHEAAGGG